MANYQEAKVKSKNTQLNKLKPASKLDKSNIIPIQDGPFWGG